MNDYLDVISSELSGEGRYKVARATAIPDGDRMISVFDRDDPVTMRVYLQSNIPLIPNDDIRSFLFRQLQLIHDGFYDNDDI